MGNCESPEGEVQGVQMYIPTYVPLTLVKLLAVGISRVHFKNILEENSIDTSHTIQLCLLVS